MADEEWLMAAEAAALVNRLNRSARDIGRVQLARWAADEIVRSRCSRWVEREEYGPKRVFENVADIAEFWDHYGKDPGDTDWEHGEFSAGDFTGIARVDHTVYGVQFHAGDIAAHLTARFLGPPPAKQPARPPYGARLPATKEPRPPKVTIDDLRQWFPAYSRTVSDFVAEHVRLDAAEHFGRHVSRAPIRQLLLENGKTERRGKRAVR